MKLLERVDIKPTNLLNLYFICDRFDRYSTGLVFNSVRRLGIAPTVLALSNKYNYYKWAFKNDETP